VESNLVVCEQDLQVHLSQPNPYVYRATCRIFVAFRHSVETTVNSLKEIGLEQMDSKLKVTDVPEESSFYDLVAGDNVLEIPLFQRPYMWKESHYKALLQDINEIDEETNGAVFLGVIVSFGRGSGPGRPPVWMIVDGQQRVTTLYLSVLAAVEVAARAGELDWASDVMGRYLLVRPMAGLSVNTKLVPSFSDRFQFNSIWKRIAEIKNFSSHKIFASNPPKPPVSSGSNLTIES
jgi:hypothetical protein